MKNQKTAEILEKILNPLPPTSTENIVYNLFHLNKKCPRFYRDDECCRFLKIGDKVEFTNPFYTRNNVLFNINGNEYWEIWYSQLASELYYGNEFKRLRGSITFKNKTPIEISFLSIDDFCEKVEDKKFEVAKVEVGFYPNMDDELCKRIENEESIYKYVHQQIINGNSEKVKKMLKPRNVYSFVEI